MSCAKAFPFAEWIKAGLEFVSISSFVAERVCRGLAGPQKFIKKALALNQGF